MFRWMLMIAVPMIAVIISNNRTLELKDHQEPGDRFFWLCACVYLLWFAGLRMRYNDTTTYLNTFSNNTVTPDLLTFLRTTSFDIGEYWGYAFVKSLLKTIGMDNHLILFTFTAFYLSTYLWFIRKYAEDFLPMAMFLFLCDGYMMLLAALKQVTATACALIAIDKLLKNKKAWYVIWMIIALTFHPYVLVLFVVPFLIDAKPWTWRTWVMILSMAVLGFGMQYTANLLARFNDVYDVESLLDHTMNPMRFVVSLVPLGISFLFREELFDDSSRAINLFAHLSICRTMFYFWALFGNPIVFARVANYFDFSNAIFLSWAINKLCNDEKNSLNGIFLKVGMYFGFLFFSFRNTVLGFQFVRQTEHISLQHFFSSISKWLGI